MKISALYHPESDHARLVTDFTRDFERIHTGQKVAILSLETKEGDALSRLYDIVRYPAIIVTTNDGKMLKVWEGDILPLMDEVASYINS